MTGLRTGLSVWERAAAKSDGARMNHAKEKEYGQKKGQCAC